MNHVLRFGMTGVAGYIAPRHLAAIQAVGGQLVAALDPSDSVGVLDRFGFHNSAFFTEPERYDRHLNRLQREGHGIDYLVVASPNYLHDAHIRLGVRNGAHVICEKPLVIKPHNLDPLIELQQETGRQISTVLQLRHHPVIIDLQRRMKSGRHHVVINYATPRGLWYHHSWKADAEKSGGLITNIGIHFLDMLLWVFGPCRQVQVRQQDAETVAGQLELERAEVTFHLTIAVGERNRRISVDGFDLNFTDGFDQLHTVVYQEVLAGRGYGLEDARPSIELAQLIRNTPAD